MGQCGRNSAWWKKESLLPFDIFACSEKEPKKKKNRENAKPSKLESFADHFRQKKLLTEPSGSCGSGNHGFSIPESKGHSLKAAYIYILLSHESKRKQMTAKNKNKPWWDLRTPFFAVESFSCMSSASLLTLNLKSLFKEKQLPTASRAPSVGTWTSAQD